MFVFEAVGAETARLIGCLDCDFAAFGRIEAIACGAANRFPACARDPGGPHRD